MDIMGVITWYRTALLDMVMMHKRLVLWMLFFAVRTPPANKNKFQKKSGAKATKKLEQLESVGHELNPKEATVFRALSARANYLAQDRVDIAYSSKELCREFAVPNQRSYNKLKRLVRYLVAHPSREHHARYGYCAAVAGQALVEHRWPRRADAIPSLERQTRAPVMGGNS